jgi:hypothetical protein
VKLLCGRACLKVTAVPGCGQGTRIGERLNSVALRRSTSREGQSCYSKYC